MYLLVGTPEQFAVVKQKTESHPEFLMVLPDEIDKADFQYLVLSGTEGNYSVTVDGSKKSTKEVEKAAKDAIGELYDTLNQQVVSDMALTFETGKPESAITNYITLLDMAQFPEEYVDKGIKVSSTLLAEDESTLFGPGDLLNTVEKVNTYSARRLQLAREYGIRRLQKIDKFIDDKNEILGV